MQAHLEFTKDKDFPLPYPLSYSSLDLHTLQSLISQHDQDTAYCSIPSHMISVSTTYSEIIAYKEYAIPEVLNYLRDNNGGMSIILLLMHLVKDHPYTPPTIKL